MKKLMKKLLVPLLCVVIAGLITATFGFSTSTMRTYITLRAVSATNDTGLAADGAKWTDISDSVVTINLDEPVGAIQIIFKITNADGEIANWCLYAIKGVGSPAEFVAYGTCTAGNTQTGGALELYADTIVITQQNWYKTVSIKEGFQYNLGTGVVGGAGVAALLFDSCEYSHWLMLMSKSTCATAGAEITNFN